MWDVANSAEESAIKTESTAPEKPLPKHALIIYILHFKGHHCTHSHSTTSFSFCLTSRTLELLPNEQVIDKYHLFQISKVLVYNFTVNLRLHRNRKTHFSHSLCHCF